MSQKKVVFNRFTQVREYSLDLPPKQLEEPVQTRQIKYPKSQLTVKLKTPAPVYCPVYLPIVYQPRGAFGKSFKFQFPGHVRQSSISRPRQPYVEDIFKSDSESEEEVFGVEQAQPENLSSPMSPLRDQILRAALRYCMSSSESNPDSIPRSFGIQEKELNAGKSEEGFAAEYNQLGEPAAKRRRYLHETN